MSIELCKVSRGEFVNATLGGTGSKHSESFEKIDLDGDGKISRAEWTAHFGSDVWLLRVWLPITGAGRL